MPSSNSIKHWNIPRNNGLYSALGKAYYWSGNKSKAHEAFRIAISIAGEDPEESDPGTAFRQGELSEVVKPGYYIGSKKIEIVINSDHITPALKPDIQHS